MATDVITVSVADLALFHPSLIWDEIIGATTIVLTDVALSRPIEVRSARIPGFGSGRAIMTVLLPPTPQEKLSRIRRTYESARLVEFAAIGMAGLVLHFLGSHEIRDVTARGSGADYLVDNELRLLEVAGRSRKSDFNVAWSQRWGRLIRQPIPFYLFVVEFESPAARFEFWEQ